VTESFLVSNAEEIRMVVSAITIAVTLAMYFSKRLTKIDTHLEKLNSQVDSNTAHRRAMQESDIERRERIATMMERLDSLNARVINEVLPSLNRLEFEAHKRKGPE